MKTNRSNIILLLPAFLFLSVSGGCYTQLAIDDNDTAYVSAPQQTIIIDDPTPVCLTCYPPPPPPPPPVYIPVAASSSGSGEAQTQPHRESGYQRGPAGNEQSSDSRTRESGSSRGGQ